VNVKLAENCPKNEKAFENQKRGKVLGILFDSTDLSWAIPVSKMKKTLLSIRTVLYSSEVTLSDMQKLMGRLNHLAQMCNFMKIFTPPLNESFKDVKSDANPGTIVNIRVRCGSDCSASACCTAGPSSNLGSAPPRRPSTELMQ
jgi:hypothetical protein